jgi:hypothetical protein
MWTHAELLILARQARALADATDTRAAKQALFEIADKFQREAQQQAFTPLGVEEPDRS